MRRLGLALLVCLMLASATAAAQTQVANGIDGSVASPATATCSVWIGVGGLEKWSIQLYSPELGTATAALYVSMSSTGAAPAVSKNTWASLATDPLPYSGDGSVPWIKVVALGVNDLNTFSLWFYGIKPNGSGWVPPASTAMSCVAD